MAAAVERAENLTFGEDGVIQEDQFEAGQPAAARGPEKDRHAKAKEPLDMSRCAMDQRMRWVPFVECLMLKKRKIVVRAWM